MNDKTVKKLGKGRAQKSRLLPPDGASVQMQKNGTRKYYRVRGKSPPLRKKTPEEVAEHRKKVQTAMDLRVASYSYGQIGKALGVSESRAYQLVKEARENLAPEASEEYLQIQLLRRDQIINYLWRDFVNTDDPDLRIRLADAIDRQMARMDKLLNVGQEIYGPQIAQQVNINNQLAAPPGGKASVLIIQGHDEEYLKSLEQAAGVRTPELDFVDVVQGDGSKTIEGELDEVEEE